MLRAQHILAISFTVPIKFSMKKQLLHPNIKENLKAKCCSVACCYSKFDTNTPHILVKKLFEVDHVRIQKLSISIRFIIE